MTSATPLTISLDMGETFLLFLEVPSRWNMWTNRVPRLYPEQFSAGILRCQFKSKHVLQRCSIPSEINDVRSYNHCFCNAECFERRDGRRRYLILAHLCHGLTHQLITGAYIQACVTFQSKPSKPFQVNFDPFSSENKCMNDVGSAANLTVTSSELTCTFIGYVESKASSSGGDFCASTESLWYLSYGTLGLDSEKSGTAISQWSYSWINPDVIQLQSYPLGTQICGEYSLCGDATFSWPSGTPMVWASYAPCRT